MRLTYLDEGGIAKHEPYVVVVGVIIHGDGQLVPVEEHLGELVEKHIPEKDRRGFVFHATNIWSGTGYFKDKEQWPLAKRLAILDDLADIPAKFMLPIAFGATSKQRVDAQSEDSPQVVRDLVYHATAYSSAAHVVERYFLRMSPEEYTIMIAEDRPLVRRMIKAVQAILQGRGPIGIPDDIMGRYDELPFNHIRDTVHFAEKAESRMLQVADICAFVIRGHFSSHPKNASLLDRLMPVILTPSALKLTEQSP